MYIIPFSMGRWGRRSPRSHESPIRLRVANIMIMTRVGIKSARGLGKTAIIPCLTRWGRPGPLPRDVPWPCRA